MKVGAWAVQESLKSTPDGVEAVVGAGHGALQINARRSAGRQVLEEDYFEEEDPMEEAVEDPDYVEEDKSTVLAMEDFFDKRLTWNYPEEERADADNKPGKTPSS